MGNYISYAPNIEHTEHTEYAKQNNVISKSVQTKSDDFIQSNSNAQIYDGMRPVLSKKALCMLTDALDKASKENRQIFINYNDLALEFEMLNSSIEKYRSLYYELKIKDELNEKLTCDDEDYISSYIKMANKIENPFDSIV
jgi:hypothetical protein